MTNVLIADLLEQSAFLLRAILRGRRYQVSIATTAEDAFDLLETGMFDVLVVDLTTPMRDNRAIVSYANRILPGLPVLAVAGAATAADGRCQDLAGIVSMIHLPIDGARVKHALTMAELTLEQKWVNRRESERRPLEIPVRLRFGRVTVPARTFNISEGGAAVMPLIDRSTLAVLRNAVPPMAVRAILGADRPHDPLACASPAPIEVDARVVAITQFSDTGRAVWNVAFDQPVTKTFRQNQASTVAPTLAHWLKLAG